MIFRNVASRFCVAIVMTAIIAAAARAETGFIPINDLGTGLYLGQYQGGLYPGGSNDVPAAHAAAGLAHAELVVPRDALGNPSPAGKYAFVSIGMSNTTQEFCGGGDTTVACTPPSFMGQALADPLVNHDTLVLVNGAKGGKSAAYWDSPADPDYDRVRDERLPALGVTEAQVQAAWVKVANPQPSSSLPNANADAMTLVGQMGDIARALKVRYPNMQQVFFSSRIYAGYATTSTLNPEPYAYESGFAVKRIVEAQIEQMNGGGIDPLAGDLSYASGVAPWIAWGPYLWADGLNPRSDGLIWNSADLGTDGTHPSMLGVEKVGAMLLDFMLNSPFTQPWFVDPLASDFDEDGEVDGDDLTRWRTNFGAGTTHLQGDADGDLDVDGRDFLVWQSQLGSATSIATTAPLPEPGALALMLVAAMLALGCQRQGGRPKRDEGELLEA